MKKKRMQKPQIILCAVLGVLLLLLLWRIYDASSTHVQTLGEACAADEWARLMLIERFPRAADSGTAIFRDTQPAEALRALIADVPVEKGSKTNIMPTPCVQIFFSRGDGAMCILCAGKNGDVIYSVHTDNDVTHTYWKSESGSIYAAAQQFAEQS